MIQWKGQYIQILKWSKKYSVTFVARNWYEYFEKREINSLLKYLSAFLFHIKIICTCTQRLVGTVDFKSTSRGTIICHLLASISKKDWYQSLIFTYKCLYSHSYTLLAGRLPYASEKPGVVFWKDLSLFGTKCCYQKDHLINSHIFNDSNCILVVALYIPPQLFLYLGSGLWLRSIYILAFMLTAF